MATALCIFEWITASLKQSSTQQDIEAFTPNQKTLSDWELGGRGAEKSVKEAVTIQVRSV